MAKLNGVKTVDMVNGEVTKISYNGAEYIKTDAILDVKEGSILRIIKRISDLSTGEFYEVLGIESGHFAAFFDDVEHRTHRDMDGRFEYFLKAIVNPAPTVESVDAKVDAIAERVAALEKTEAKPQYKTVKRPAKVGERILITEAAPIYGQSYEEGDVFMVTEVGVRGSMDVYVAGQSEFIDYLEYVVIVEEAQATPKPIAGSISHNGADYTLVDRKAQPGDVVVFTENTNRYFTNGKAYGPISVSDGGNLVATDNDGDSLKVYFASRGRTESNVLVYTPKVEPLKAGDYITVDTLKYSLDITVGKAYEVFGNSNGELYIIDDIGDARFHPIRYEAYTKVDKPDAKTQLFAKLGRKLNEYRVGDIVRGYSDMEDRELYGVIEDLSDGGVYTGVRTGDKYRALLDIDLIAPVESRVDVA